MPKEYIEKEALMEGTFIKAENIYQEGWNDALHGAYSAIPAADVVEVVRCKDCKHWGGITFGRTCRMFSGVHTRVEMSEDNFCSYGERRE